MEPMTVSEVSRIVKDTLRSTPELTDIAVRGEVTGYSDRGHIYFSIKDDSSVLKCTIWKSSASSIGALPLKDGDKVVVWGSITSWGGNSSYQLDVRRCVPEGTGELYRQYLELKKRLLEEGLFDPAHKKLLPAYPNIVGIVTSEKGAALQDMAKVFMSGPGVQIITCDARVQGEGSAASIAAGIKVLDGKVDIIIIGRGGGSIEDLWAFNDEALARAVYSCQTPIISGVGHEVDEVITDHVADCRASTPTAAAELVVKGMQAVIDEKSRLMDCIALAACDRVRSSRQMLDSYDMQMRRRLLASKIEAAKASIGAIQNDLAFSLSRKISGARTALASGDAALRTTWVAAMAENGLAAMYQDGKRVHDAAAFKKGKFQAMMRDGKITGEVKDIEI